MLALGRERRFAAGATLFAADEPADWLGIVLEGRLAVKKAAVFPGRHILLAELEDGGLVGEGALLADASHGATVTAVSDCRLLTWERAQLTSLAVEQPELALKLNRRVVEILRLRLRGAGERLSWIL